MSYGFDYIWSNLFIYFSMFINALEDIFLFLTSSISDAINRLNLQEWAEDLLQWIVDQFGIGGQSVITFMLGTGITTYFAIVLFKFFKDAVL